MNQQQANKLRELRDLMLKDAAEGLYINMNACPHCAFPRAERLMGSPKQWGDPDMLRFFGINTEELYLLFAVGRPNRYENPLGIAGAMEFGRRVEAVLRDHGA